jgi:hypothetical protein
VFSALWCQVIKETYHGLLALVFHFIVRTGLPDKFDLLGKTIDDHVEVRQPG